MRNKTKGRLPGIFKGKEKEESGKTKKVKGKPRQQA